MRIAIDARKLHDYGIGTYITNVIIELAQLDETNEYIFLCRQDDCQYINSLADNFHSVPQRSANYSISEQLSIPINLTFNSIDLFHAPHYVLPVLTPCRSIVTIHDCIHLKFPQYLPNRIASMYAWSQLWIAVKRAQAIITVSEHSKNDIAELLNVPKEKISVIPNAVSKRFTTKPTNELLTVTKESLRLERPFIMYSGNVKPHKNISTLIDAFKLVQSRNHSEIELLIVGSHGTDRTPLEDQVQQLDLQKHVRFLGFQSEDRLAGLYQLAEIFVLPSLYEGFGLGPLEAMASGTPVVASNVASLPEVLGKAALFIDPRDAGSIANGITAILDDDLLRSDLIEKGRNRAQAFSWKRTAQQIHRIYEQIGVSN